MNCAWCHRDRPEVTPEKDVCRECWDRMGPCDQCGEHVSDRTLVREHDGAGLWLCRDCLLITGGR